MGPHPEDDARSGETEQERIDRNLGDLLQELRVAFPGVQILFAFLLVVPFQQGWTDVDDTARHVYYGALVLTAISSVCFIAPTARHRLRFRERDLRWVVESSHRLMVAGLISLGGAIAAVLLLVTMVVFSDLFALVMFSLLVTLIVWVWFAAPMTRARSRSR
jgi:VIT1/CCC1 family predicted Fe2+/Mn2+ transporter